MSERFVVGCVSGYPITAATIACGRKANPKPRSVWYVWDRAYGYEIVGEFRNARRGKVISGEERARALAARLNEGV